MNALPPAGLSASTCRDIRPSRKLGLWHHHDFLRLWAAQSASVFGSEIATLALPLTAVLIVEASPGQVGILRAAQYAPYLLVGLIVGVFVDRLRRRPILVGADLGRAALLGSIPIAVLVGSLGMEHLYVVAFLVGTLRVFHDVAVMSFLPPLVHSDQLVEGNSKLEASSSAAQLVGPSLAGTLVQLTAVPITIALNGLAFLLSALLLGLIGTTEPAPRPRDRRSNIFDELRDGLRSILRNPLLRAMVGCAGTSNLFSSAVFAIHIPYASRELDIEPGTLGLIFAAGGIGALAGTLVAGRVAGHIGLGPALIGATLLNGGGLLLVPMAGGLFATTVALLVAAQALFGLGCLIYRINHTSLRQAITPDHLQGRVNASARFLTWGAMPIGALLGGALGETIGLRPALMVGASGAVLAVLWLLISPARALRDHPREVDAHRLL